MAKKYKPEETALVHAPLIENKEALSLSFDPSGVDGVRLINVSVAQLEKEYGQRLVAFTAGTMQQIVNLRYTLEQTQKHIAFQEARLKAIKENQFSVDQHANIHFNEAALNG